MVLPDNSSVEYKPKIGYAEGGVTKGARVVLLA
jgi:hypothetical protein